PPWSPALSFLSYSRIASVLFLPPFPTRRSSDLAPARGMPTLSAKDGFSRPSSFRSVGSHRGLWDCDYSTHRKHFLPLESRERMKDRKSTRLNSSHVSSSYAVFCLKKKSNTLPLG